MITKKRKSDLENDNLSTPHIQTFEDVDGEDLPKVDADYVADLERQLKRLQESREDQRDDQLLYLDQRPNQSQVTAGPVEVKVESIPLPDPALDPEGFSAANNKRVQITLENERRRYEFDTKRKNDIDTRIKGLWANFNNDYEEYSGNDAKIEFATQQVLQEATARGVDPERYMFVTQNKFFRDVAKKYDTIFGEPEQADDTLDDDIPSRNRREANSTSRRQPRNRRGQEDDEGRSAGIFGGNESGGRPTRRQQEEDKPTDMIEVLQAEQRKMGLY